MAFFKFWYLLCFQCNVPSHGWKTKAQMKSHRWRDHRWRVTDEEITDEESQMKMGWKTQAKIMISRYLTLTIKVKIKKTTHFTMNVLKRNIRTNFLFVILYIFVVKKRHISMLKVKLYFFSLFLKFCFGRSGAFLCNLWSC
jgi:hypothetical protein